MGIPTFMRTPIIDDPSHIDIALIGIPYDGAVTNRPGARLGPREIRNASSMMRSINSATRVNPYELCRIGDAGDVPFNNMYDVVAAHTDIASFIEGFHVAGVVPLCVGGDHSVTLPIFRAIAADKPVGMIQFDAHTDTWDEFMGSRFCHGSQFRRAVEEGLLDPKRTVQIGIRGAQNTTESWDFPKDNGMRTIFMEEFTRLGVEKVIDEARKIVGDGPTYISFDIDGLDPAFAPGTGTPEVGGLTSIEAQAVLRGLRGLNLVGADVVEVAPPYDPSGMTTLAGATMMYEILCILAESVSDHP